jgi:hypothetical protein
MRKLVQIVSFLLCLGVGRAGVIQLVFDSSTMVAFPGQTITFTGTVFNSDSSNAYDLNSCNVNFVGPLTTDCTQSFLVFAPFSLDPLQTYPATPPGFPILTVSVDPAYAGPWGPQSGSFDVVGGTDTSTFNVIGTAEFTVNVAPEPSTWLTAVGLGLLLVRRRWCLTHPRR